MFYFYLHGFQVEFILHLGNFVKYHAHSSAKFNNIFVLYIVADDSIKNYELVTSNENNLVITTVYFKRGFLSISTILRHF